MPFASAHNPRRILMTADTVGGVWTYALDLARALKDNHIEIALATMGAPLNEAQWNAVRALPHVTVYESRYKLEWMDHPWDDVEAAGRWLLDLEAQVQPDLIHLNNYAHGALPWNAPVLVVGHSCVYSWFEAVRGIRPPSAWEHYRRTVTQGLQHADRVTAPTRAMLDALRRHYGTFRAGPVVYNGRSRMRFLPGSPEPFILTAGRLWDDAKNVAALADVAPRLPWPVSVAGTSVHPDGGRAQFDGVRLLGRLPPAEMAGWMRRAAIFALPARYEPFGLAALEAGLSGCALVLGDLPSLHEVWGNAALFVPPDDPEALVTTLQRLIDDPDRRAAYARRALQRARRFSLRRMGAGYLALYGRLLPAPVADDVVAST